LRELWAFEDEFCSSGAELMIEDGMLSDESLDDAIAMSDCIIVAHTNEGPSGLLGKAAAAGTRVLAAGATTLRKDCMILGDSATWVPLDLQAMTRAVDETFRSAPASVTPTATPSEFCCALLHQ
jgi:hypothetical protein